MSITAYVFPGQGSQFKGMGAELLQKGAFANDLLQQADKLLGFPLSEVMLHGSEEDLKKTNVTQPAIFVHSVVHFLAGAYPAPHMVAGHSLGEFSALVACGCLDFASALRLVSIRAAAMQRACELNPGTMAAVMGYTSEEQVEDICRSITDEVVVPANYNAPGQLVISGTLRGIDIAIEKLKAAGVKRALKLPVGGAFHSPLMQSAASELETAIHATSFNQPRCPIYQNYTAAPETDPEIIRRNLIAQLTAPVRWTQTIRNMSRDGASAFTEIGPGKVLTGLIAKICG
ncbi:MAG: ACP S-malonyltransferase [Chitinophagales bacterium]|nr:ACP S-malonyltransferase [Chitinophagales bacterium]MDW8419567.1 ACP S-malonyltransferase [Chitinophagales bacterium]